MSVQINGTNGLVFADGSTQKTAANGSFKNRILNGDMRIDQRNAGASVTATGGFGVYTLDRWTATYSTGSKFSVQQNAGSVTPPVGFTHYLGMTSLGAYSVPSNETYNMVQKIEGFNVADLGWGTANAATVTLSFWVRSSLTGTFGGSLKNSAANRTYPFSYTISAANTWEQKSITIAGDTSGTWLTNNGTGIELNICLGAGSTFSGTAGSWSGSHFFSATGATSVVGTNGATFYITGVQLEKGSTATSFDYRPYGTELALCQRYYEPVSVLSGIGYASVNAYDGRFGAQFKVSKRTNPTVTRVSGTATNRTAGGSGANTGNPNTITTEGFDVLLQASSGTGIIEWRDGQYTASAEL